MRARKTSSNLLLKPLKTLLRSVNGPSLTHSLDDPFSLIAQRRSLFTLQMFSNHKYFFVVLLWLRRFVPFATTTTQIGAKFDTNICLMYNKLTYFRPESRSECPRHIFLSCWAWAFGFTNVSELFSLFWNFEVYLTFEMTTKRGTKNSTPARESNKMWFRVSCARPSLL